MELVRQTHDVNVIPDGDLILRDAGMTATPFRGIGGIARAEHGHHTRLRPIRGTCATPHILMCRERFGEVAYIQDSEGGHAATLCVRIWSVHGVAVPTQGRSQARYSHSHHNETYSVGTN
jgi:hypothetical protein